MILKRIFNEKKNGFYIDVGAHHPKRFSNTHYFYLKGWRGINIDAMPSSMKLFNKQRPKDINLEIAISDKKEVLTYYGFNESALNSFSKEISNQRDGLNDYKIIRKEKIQTYTLEEVLDKN
ncbi:FkbM family methyltransferase, partial [Candidatus Parcubacteria bacterium]|nr:FkbM family methyltransferase [Candidatus Parcubacteria bacterium]